MDIRQALTCAVSFTADEGPHACVKLSAARGIEAANGMQGVAIACEAITVDMAVNGKVLLRMIRAIGSCATLTVVEGRKLCVEGAGARYTLQALPVAKEPKFPDPPADWTPVTSEQAQALCAIAKIPDEKVLGNAALTGVRLTANWAAASTNNMPVIAWIKGLVTDPMTVAPQVFKGMEAQAVAAEDHLFWLRDEAQQRWSRTHEAEWPDASVQQLVAGSRGGQGRIGTGVDLTALTRLCKQAAAVDATAADVHRLILSPKGLTLVGGCDGPNPHGAREFAGTLGSVSIPATTDTIGVSAALLHQLVACVDAVPSTAQYISIGDRNTPVMIWNAGDVVIEALLLPMYYEP